MSAPFDAGVTHPNIGPPVWFVPVASGHQALHQLSISTPEDIFVQGEWAALTAKNSTTKRI